MRLCSRLVPRSIVGVPLACGSRDIRNIVSACTVWLTFVFRTPTPRAVEDFIVEVLHDPRGSCPHGFCLASLICILIISQTLRFVKTFFLFFLLAVRLERTSSLCRLNRRHQPQIGEPESNEWGGTPEESPHLSHTICVLCPYCITL